MYTPRFLHLCVGAALALQGACSSEEAVRVTLPAMADSRGVQTSTNDLGYTVQLTRMRVALRDVQFTIRGEMHARRGRLSRWLLPEAAAHPGHYAGGEITGQIIGAFVPDFAAAGGSKLGEAVLIAGTYQGANFTFRRADDSDKLAADDPLRGHSVHLEGSAVKEGKQLRFTALLDIKDNTQLVGAPFQLAVTPTSTATLALQALTVDPSNGNSLFQGIDFLALDGDGDGQVTIAPEPAPSAAAHNILARTLQVHDFYNVTTR